MENNNNEPIDDSIKEPINEGQNEDPNGVQKKRGFWLTAFLILAFIANPTTAWTYFSNTEAIIQVYPQLTPEIIYFLGFMAIINFILAVGIWTWKKWGVYGFYVSVLIAFAINLSIGMGIAASLVGLVGAVLIYLTTKNRWQYFS